MLASSWHRCDWRHSSWLSTSSGSIPECLSKQSRNAGFGENRAHVLNINGRSCVLIGWRHRVVPSRRNVSTCARTTGHSFNVAQPGFSTVFEASREVRS